jgi:hypothetical protein
MRHARPLAILTAAALVLGLPLAVWAQAAPEAAAVAPVAADPLLTLLGSLGPTGGAGAVVALVWRAWRAESERHATERAELRDRITALELASALGAERHRALIETLGSIRAALERA